MKTMQQRWLELYETMLEANDLEGAVYAAKRQPNVLELLSDLYDRAWQAQDRMVALRIAFELEEKGAP